MGTVLVIGGGAAGLAAAIAAAECGDRVTILERMDRVGKKILATGNGRCNLMNTGERRYPGGNAFADEVLNRCGFVEQTRFWHHIGLRMRQEEGGRVYPVSGMASSVLDALRFAAEALGVETMTGVHVTGVFKARHGWTVMAGEEKWKADRVIIAGGGCAQPKLGSDGSAWALLEMLGHSLVQPKPALTQIVTDITAIKGLSGIRVRTEISISRNGQAVYGESGELLFADYGVTGVCVMQCARYVAPGDVMHINLVKAMGFDEEDAFRQELHRRRTQWGHTRKQCDLLTGLCVPKLAQALLAAAGMHGVQHSACGELNAECIDRLVRVAGDFTMTVRGVKGFESAQVTAGGIATDHFNPATMESNLAHGIHAAGEVLDVDGDCGGYNLMFAFGSGILAGLGGRAFPW